MAPAPEIRYYLNGLPIIGGIRVQDPVGPGPQVVQVPGPSPNQGSGVCVEVRRKARTEPAADDCFFPSESPAEEEGRPRPLLRCGTSARTAGRYLGALGALEPWERRGAREGGGG